METEASGRYLRPVLFVEAEFLSGWLRVHSGIGPIVWNGETWTGVGSLGSVDGITEASVVRADNFTISLSGIPSEYLSKALDECRPQLPCNVYFGCLDESGAVIATPTKAASGLMDVPSVQDGAETCTISITVENRLFRLNVANELRYTHESQQIFFPGDLFFQFVPKIQEWNGVWGKPGTSSSGGSGHIGGGLGPAPDPDGDGKLPNIPI